MLSTKPTLLAAALLLAGAAPAFAQQNDALMKLLIQKGIITQAEADQLVKEAAAATPTPPPAAASGPMAASTAPAVDAKKWVATSGGKYLERLTFSGRFQSQFAYLDTDIAGTAADPAATDHFFLRRMYLGAKADMAGGWSGNLNYDFAGSTFDAAFVEWKQSKQLVLDIGFRKVPFGLEEWATSSGNLRAIERSPATRFFVESNNGRRLGAGSYRTGVFVGGATDEGITYNFAVTNPERDESAAGVTSGGTAANNTQSFWGNIGYGAKFDGGDYRVSASVGDLPDQGGRVLGAGDDLWVYNLFGELNRGPVNVQLEWFGSNNDHGASATLDSKSWGYSIQPAYRMGDVEGVLRYSYVDSDGRGVQTADGIRSAPSGGTMDKLSEWYLGLNWYIRGNDVKWQVGYIHGESKDALTGAAAKATTDGIRSQMQLNF